MRHKLIEWQLVFLLLDDDLVPANDGERALLLFVGLRVVVC